MEGATSVILVTGFASDRTSCVSSEKAATMISACITNEPSALRVVETLCRPQESLSVNAFGDRTGCEIARRRTSRTGPASALRTRSTDSVGMARFNLVMTSPAITNWIRSNQAALAPNRNSYADLCVLSYLTVGRQLRPSSGHLIGAPHFE